MHEPVAVILLAALARWAIACGPSDDDAETGGQEDSADSSQQAQDRQVCRDGAVDLPEVECPPGFLPQYRSGHIISTVVLAEDAAVPICGDQGLLVDFGAVPGAEWVGYEATKNSICAFGCFASCNAGQMGCFDLRTGGHYCNWSIDEQSCTDFVANGTDACGLESTDDDGGSDETTGG